MGDQQQKDINRQYQALLASDTLHQMSFSTFQNNSGLMLLNGLLHFEDCGMEMSAREGDSRQSVFCMYPIRNERVVGHTVNGTYNHHSWDPYPWDDSHHQRIQE